LCSRPGKLTKSTTATKKNPGRAGLLRQLPGRVGKRTEMQLMSMEIHN